MCVCVCVCVWLCAWVSDTARERECVGGGGCACVSDTARERESVCVCVCVLLYIAYFIYSVQTVLFVGSRPALSVESLAHVFKSCGRATLQWNPSLLMTSPRILISSARGVPGRERVCCAV